VAATLLFAFGAELLGSPRLELRAYRDDRTASQAPRVELARTGDAATLRIGDRAFFAVWSWSTPAQRREERETFGE